MLATQPNSLKSNSINSRLISVTLSMCTTVIGQLDIVFRIGSTLTFLNFDLYFNYTEYLKPPNTSILTSCPYFSEKTQQTILFDVVKTKLVVPAQY